MSSYSWINSLDTQKLQQLIGELPTNDFTQEKIDEIGQHMGLSINAHYNESVFRHSRVRINYWSLVKHEFDTFVCTKDKKYRELRNKLSDEGAKVTTLIVSTISAALAEKIGIMAGVITPLLLFVYLQLPLLA